MAVEPPNSTFPKRRHSPSQPPQVTLRLPVSFDITLEFLGPKFGTSGWNGREPTSRMAMPEAAVNEDGGAVLGENDVRPPRKARDVQPKAKPLCVE